jgi:hypothetical protein
MYRSAVLCMALSMPIAMGFNVPLIRGSHGLLRSVNSLNRLKMVASPIRTDPPSPTDEEWQGTSTLDRQLVRSL